MQISCGEVYAYQRLSLDAIRERLTKERPRSEPDSGNPTVRDRREACGNVVIMGAGLRPTGNRWMIHVPHHTITRAPHFYPDYVRNVGQG